MDCRHGPDHGTKNAKSDGVKYHHIVNGSSEATLRPAVLQQSECLRKGGKWWPEAWAQVEAYFRRWLG